MQIGGKINRDTDYEYSGLLVNVLSAQANWYLGHRRMNPNGTKRTATETATGFFGRHNPLILNSPVYHPSGC
jgi:hypothetical protein